MNNFINWLEQIFDSGKGDFFGAILFALLTGLAVLIRYVIRLKELKIRRALVSAYMENIADLYNLKTVNIRKVLNKPLRKEIYKKQIRILEEWNLLSDRLKTFGVPDSVLNNPVLFYKSLAQRIKLMGAGLDIWGDEIYYAIETLPYFKATAGEDLADLDWLCTYCGFNDDLKQAIKIDLTQPDVPNELHFAISKFVNLAKISESTLMRDAAGARKYILSISGYTHLEDSLISRQEQLAKFIATQSFGEESRFVTKDFGATIQEMAVSSNRILYLFPFFWVPSRQNRWGILPFAKQNTIGFILHKNHPSLKHLHGLINNSSSEALLPAGETAEWIEHAIADTERIGGILYWVNGFIFYEILTQILDKRNSPNAGNALARCQSPVSIDQQFRLRQFGGRTLGDSKSIFIFDPGELHLFRKKLQRDFKIIICTHNLDIPAGVGFSLPFLPSILCGAKWREILLEAKKQYTPLRAELYDLGIKINQ